MMRILWTLLLSCLCYAAPMLERRIDENAMRELATQLGICKDADLIAETQKQWLRQSGKERWEMQELSLEQKQNVLKWAFFHGLYSAWTAFQKQYDKVLILGASSSRMEQRLAYFKKLWADGVRCKEIVWLTGKRPLDPKADHLANLCADESEAARMIWNEAEVPNEMRELNVVFIEVPMQGSMRPNTEDTLLAWQAMGPPSCSALFISDQPFCGYQYAVIENTLSDAICFDVAGAGADPLSHPAAAAITLDSIARWVYQQHQNREE